MDVIEKQIEKVKELPADCWDNRSRYGHNYRGIAGTALGLGIAGTVLGLGAWSRNGGFNLFGNGGGANTPQNVNINTANDTNFSSPIAPTAFQVWEKESSDILATQKNLYDLALLQQNQRFADRSILNSELFGVYKSQVDGDFNLYKSNRDGFDILSSKMNQGLFSLYKETRDKDDELRKEISDLRAQVAINTAIRPYQDKLIQCEIDRVACAGFNYTDKKTCKAIYGQVTLPNTPVITGYAGANQCGCPTIVQTATT